MLPFRQAGRGGRGPIASIQSALSQQFSLSAACEISSRLLLRSSLEHVEWIAATVQVIMIITSARTFVNEDVLPTDTLSALRS